MTEQNLIEKNKIRKFRCRCGCGNYLFISDAKFFPKCKVLGIGKEIYEGEGFLLGIKELKILSKILGEKK